MKHIGRYLLLIIILIALYRGQTQTIFKTHYVTTGETLWSIASNYNCKDKRKLIYDIRALNHITPIIHEGQKIIIPVEVER